MTLRSASARVRKSVPRDGSQVPDDPIANACRWPRYDTDPGSRARRSETQRTGRPVVEIWAARTSVFSCASRDWAVSRAQRRGVRRAADLVLEGGKLGQPA